MVGKSEAQKNASAGAMRPVSAGADNLHARGRKAAAGDAFGPIKAPQPQRDVRVVGIAADASSQRLSRCFNHDKAAESLVAKTGKPRNVRLQVMVLTDERRRPVRFASFERPVDRQAARPWVEGGPA